MTPVTEVLYSDLCTISKFEKFILGNETVAWKHSQLLTFEKKVAHQHFIKPLPLMWPFYLLIICPFAIHHKQRFKGILSLFFLNISTESSFLVKTLRATDKMESQNCFDLHFSDE